MIKSNKLFCYPDTLQNKFIPQAWQITIMGEFIKKEDRRWFILVKIIKLIKN